MTDDFDTAVQAIARCKAIAFFIPRILLILAAAGVIYWSIKP